MTEAKRRYDIYRDDEGQMQVSETIVGDFPIVVDEQYLIAILDFIGSNLAKIGRFGDQCNVGSEFNGEINEAMAHTMEAINIIQRKVHGDELQTE